MTTSEDTGNSTATAADRAGTVPAGSGLDGAGFLLGAAHRARRRQWEASLADLGLTAPQAAVLRLIAASPGLGVRRLAHQLGTDPMNAQRIAETLTAAGLCETRRDPADARRRPLHPTPQGQQLAETVTRRAVQDEKALADALGTADYQALLAGLRSILAHDDQQRWQRCSP